VAVPRELTMPKLSDSMADAVIVRWLKAPGEAFARGDALLEVETDKATVIHEAEHDGMLAAILVPEGGTAGVGEAIATLSNGDAEAPARPPAAEPGRDPVPPRAPAPVVAADGDDATGRRPNATPVARRVAVELGVSLHGLSGTGPAGRVTVEDVKAAAASSGPAPAPQPAYAATIVGGATLAPDESLNTEVPMGMGRGILLWLLGIPLPIIILLALFWR